MSGGTVTIEDDRVTFETPEGRKEVATLDALIQRIAGSCRRSGGLHPAGVRLVESAGPVTIWVYEIPPAVRRLKWIAADSPAPYGPGSKYRMVRVALPYVVILSVFQEGTITNHNEAFFRVMPLGDGKDELLYPALLNCSRFEPQEGKPLSWICTTTLETRRFLRERAPHRRMAAGLKAVCHCLFETGFNFSSDEHEFSSWYTESRKVDPRVSTIERWEKASEEEPFFVLEVPWLKTGKTLEQVIQRIFDLRGGRRRTLKSAGDIGRLVVQIKAPLPDAVL